MPEIPDWWLNATGLTQVLFMVCFCTVVLGIGWLVKGAQPKCRRCNGIGHTRHRSIDRYAVVTQRCVSCSGTGIRQ